MTATTNATSGDPITPAGATHRHVEPLDPRSDKGRDVAARLSRVFADIEDEIATRPKTKHA